MEITSTVVAAPGPVGEGILTTVLPLGLLALVAIWIASNRRRYR